VNAHLFESQRYMRDRLRAALRRGVVGLLDVGSSKIACLVLRADPELLDAARPPGSGTGPQGGYGTVRVIGFASVQSRGVARGEITQMDEAERGIRTALSKAQARAGERVDQVIVAMSGGGPRSYGVSGLAPVRNGEVTEQDVAEALAACEMPPFGPGRDVVHAQPVNFTLDHRTGLADPRGQVGSRLAVDLHVLTVAHGVVRNLAGALRRCDLELAGIAVAPYAAGLAALVEDELELGAACIDFGAETTSVSIFLRRQMIYADTVPFGGAHVTQDIARAFATPLDEAERIKVKHGELHATARDDREPIEMRRVGPEAEAERRTVMRADLIGVMRPRVEEILEEVRQSLDAAGFDCLPAHRAVLTGGAAQVPGLEDVAARVLGCQIRVGRPLRIQGLPQAAAMPQFSAIVGLAAHAAQPQDETWDFDLPERTGAARFRRAVRWFRENW
jgi:cell division protein FtsA